MWRELTTSGTVKGGTYRLTFNVPSILPLPSISVPKSVELAGWKLTLQEYRIDNALHSIVIVVKLEEMSVYSGASLVPAAVAIPVSTIVIALAALTGLGLVAFTLSKVEELVESPQGTFVVIAIIGLAAYAIFKR